MTTPKRDIITIPNHASPKMRKDILGLSARMSTSAVLRALGMSRRDAVRNGYLLTGVRLPTIKPPPVADVLSSPPDPCEPLQPLDRLMYIPGLDLNDVIEAVARSAECTKADLVGRRRCWNSERRLMMMFMKRCCRATHSRIALFLGRSDHSAVTHGMKKFEENLMRDRECRALHGRVVRWLNGWAGRQKTEG